MLEWKSIESTRWIKDKDKKILSLLESYYDVIGIGKECYEILEFHNIPCWPYEPFNWIFGVPNSKYREELKTTHNPHIWNIIKTINIADGAGYGHAHKIKDDHGYTRAVYRLIDGKWLYQIDRTEIEKVNKIYNL